MVQACPRARASRNGICATSMSMSRIHAAQMTILAKITPIADLDILVQLNFLYTLRSQP